MLINRIQYYWTKIKEKQTRGSVMVEAILILVGIFTPYYGVGIRCMA